jgi:hypothetical protein
MSCHLNGEGYACNFDDFLSFCNIHVCAHLLKFTIDHLHRGIICLIKICSNIGFFILFLKCLLILF